MKQQINIVMSLKFIILFLCLPLLLSFTFKAGYKKIKINDQFNYISINEIRMWVSNNGDGSHDPDGHAGFYWPGGDSASLTAVYGDGLVWGFIVDSIIVNGNTWYAGLQAGKILANGQGDDPGLIKYRVYKIRRGWHTLNWPSGPGARDTRNVISTGPFAMAAGDTQEIVLAIFMARGTSHLNSISELKNKAVEIHHFYGNSWITVNKENKDEKPLNFSLNQKYPNPFNSITTIEFQIPGSEFVILKIYNLLGQEISTLVSQKLSPGTYRYQWDATGFASGVYLYKIQTSGGFTATKKLLLLK